MPTSSTTPRVSIGLPVRNGQRFLSAALESLLAQTFSDFEVIVCDNASTDNTEQVARAFAARDPRVRYHRHAANLGPAGNFNSTFQMSRGEYFRWHAHDDLCAPDYLRQCVDALDRDPTAVLAYPKTLIIDEKGQPLEDYDFKLATDSPDAPRRFAQLVLVNHRRHRAVEIFGLMRSSALRLTPLQGSYARADSVLLVRLALLGRFVEVPQRLFLSRCHAAQSMQTLPEHARNGRSRLARYLGTGPLPPPEWWDRSRQGKVNFPEWNLLKQYWESVGMSPLNGRQRWRSYLVMLKWVALNVPKLARDLIFAVETLVSRAAGVHAKSPAQAA
jgi:glycosyltransferase involved in cell wall biosynthesis